jgi:hypothetical protein
MDVRNIKSVFPDGKYDAAIEEYGRALWGLLAEL